MRTNSAAKQEKKTHTHTMQRCTPDKHKINRTNLITIIIDDDDVTTVRWVVCWNQCSSENHYTCVWTCARICAIVFWWFRTEMIESARIIAGNVYWGWMQRWAARSMMPKVWNPAAVQLIGRKNIRVWMEPTLMIAKYTHLLSIGYLNLRAAVYIYVTLTTSSYRWSHAFAWSFAF